MRLFCVRGSRIYHRSDSRRQRRPQHLKRRGDPRRGMYERDQLFIDGKWTVPDSDAVISVISPHSEAVIGHAACAGPADVNRAVEAARAAFDTGPWPRMQPAERIEAITRLAGVYKERRADMAALISAEIGAPISFAKRAQVGLPLM